MSLVIDVQKDLSEGLKQAKIILDEGGVVVVPSETVYGLAGNIYSKKAVENIYRVKNRPHDNPLICHINNFDEICVLAQLTKKQQTQVRTLAQKFWPGALSLVLPKNISIKKTNYAAEGFNTVAIRMPSHPIFRMLLQTVGYPLAAPSANLSGRPSGTYVEDIERELLGRVPLIFKDSPSLFGLESTVVDLTQSIPVILRPGSISLEELKAVLPDIQLIPAQKSYDENQLLKSPGQKYRHYQPHFPVYLWDEHFPKHVDQSIKKRAIITYQPEETRILELYGDVWVYIEVLDMAKDLYHLLYSLENQGYEELWIQKYPLTGVGLALMERLERIAEN